MILEVDNVALSFADKKILYGIYLKAETGKITGILGRNGSGKTSLLRIIFGDLNPKYKNIRLNGNYQKNKLFSTNSIAYLPQHQLLPNNITLLTAFKLFNLNWNSFIIIFDAFKAYKKTNTSQLSSGELRIVETYLILNSKKKIILLDEPFSFIAPIYIERIKNLIATKKNESILIITDHFYNEIIEISDAIYFLKNGCSKLIHSTKDLENQGYLYLDNSTT